MKCVCKIREQEDTLYLIGLESADAAAGTAAGGLFHFSKNSTSFFCCWGSLVKFFYS